MTDSSFQQQRAAAAPNVLDTARANGGQSELRGDATVARVPPDAGARLLRRLTWLLIVISLCAFAVVVIRTAWVSDDAYISFRTVDNLLNGYGPRWNIAERVQSYTHPLWMLMLTGVAALFGNIYLSALGLSFALTAYFAGGLVAHLRRQPWLLLVAVTTIVLSKAFVDYSTSGLENALSHALLVTLMLVTAGGVRTRGGAFRLGILVALVGLTRMDLLVLAGPIALIALFDLPGVSQGSWSGLKPRPYIGAADLQPGRNAEEKTRPYIGAAGLQPGRSAEERPRSNIGLPSSLLWGRGFSPGRDRIREAPALIRARLPLLIAFALGFWPLAAWEGFSIVYYGVPFPNTAYAKLNTGIAAGASMTQGVSYFLDSLNRDPIMLLTLVSVPVLAFVTRSRAAYAASGAILLYMAYVLRIGGDFMSGRFFTAPLVVALCTLPRIDWPRSWLVRAAPLALAIAVGFGAPDLTLLSGTDFPEGIHASVFPITGVADERGFYFERTGLITPDGIRREPDVADMMRRLAAKRQGDSTVYIYDTIGMPGFYAGPGRHIVDLWALSDPLLARLPALPKWRIGHYTRALPDGYIESLIEDRNVITDPAVARLYDRVRLLTRGPLWSRQRWKAIACENLGIGCR